MEFGDDIHEELAVNGIKTFSGLVQDEEFGVAHEGEAELDFLLHTGAEFADLFSGGVVQVDAFEVFETPFFGVLEAFEVAKVGHDVDDGFFHVETAFFGEVANDGFL